MQSHTLQRLKKKAAGLIEGRLLKTGRVLDIRKWEPSTIIEIDLHLPQTTMDSWHEVPYIKCKVADFTYRDYTPSGWDAETQTCTLYVDAGHNGAGSKWAQQLQNGDTVSYAGTNSTRQMPSTTSSVICLGDESSIGHLLAMQQLTLPGTRFSGAVVMGNPEHRNQFKEYFRSPLQPIARNDVYGHHSLTEWLLQQSYNLQNTFFYIVGNNTMVVELRKLLKKQGYNSNQIKSQGFWS
ncbi:SIP domain-containing protein [Mucilaginibacter terrae]|uniref:NADPH-dependent ferric siderophore reductase n=1 Tax=Mucilaginibacter terrae TaxID=1955052 RepID=A0ABU3GZJ7_9SPHI|nr:SIP domain-containing protein [Mucilaginibacter terrae]MDT3405198.1 NADPH-dependent ferric siderophore reductase [Mucilaginibacter terrae]